VALAVADEDEEDEGVLVALAVADEDEEDEGVLVAVAVEEGEDEGEFVDVCVDVSEGDGVDDGVTNTSMGIARVNLGFTMLPSAESQSPPNTLGRTAPDIITEGTTCVAFDTKMHVGETPLSLQKE
jgi:hypothetical protein